MIIVDHLDERFNFTALLHSLLAHATCDLCRIPFDAGNKSIWEGMLLRASVDWLYDHDLDGRRSVPVQCFHANSPTSRSSLELYLFARIPSLGNDGYSAYFKDCGRA